MYVCMYACLSTNTLNAISQVVGTYTVNIEIFGVNLILVISVVGLNHLN